MQSPETRCAHSWDGFKRLLAFEDRYRSYVVVLGGPRLPLSPSGTFTGHSDWMQVTHTLARAFFNFWFILFYSIYLLFFIFLQSPRALFRWSNGSKWRQTWLSARHTDTITMPVIVSAAPTEIAAYVGIEVP
ncbi:hypothetical protein LZ31DRAFT_33548 [Colletotrichum somersetense]|nr:hypothetical protein LZ31DRAFT_33548 [Colletotrichum somersetense]